MANLTAKYAKWVHGKNPQFLIEEVIRWRIYETRYWMEECFALSAAQLAGKAMELKYVSGTVAPATRPTPFLCLVAKMLQIQPDMDIVLEFIKNEEFKYMRCLGMYYFRLVADQIDIYKTLEPYYIDFRKIKKQNFDGSFTIMYIDEFVDALLHEERFLSIQLPRLSKRRIFEANDLLEPRISPIEAEFDEMVDLEQGQAQQSSEMDDTDSELEAKYSMKIDFDKIEQKQEDRKKKKEIEIEEQMKFGDAANADEIIAKMRLEQEKAERRNRIVQSKNLGLEDYNREIANFKETREKILDQADENIENDEQEQAKRRKIDQYYNRNDTSDEEKIEKSKKEKKKSKKEKKSARKERERREKEEKQNRLDEEFKLIEQEEKDFRRRKSRREYSDKIAKRDEEEGRKYDSVLNEHRSKR